MTKNSSILHGPLPARLANQVSEAISTAIFSGMEVDEACCVAAHVIADYARGSYGDAYLPDLAEIITGRAGAPLPKVRGDG